MRFRSTVFVALLALTCGITIATVAVVATVIDRAERVEAADELAESLAAFGEFADYRQSLLRVQGRVVVEEPRLKAVMAAHDVAPGTVYGVAEQMRVVAGADLFLLVDATGTLRADVSNRDAPAADMRNEVLVTRALEDEVYGEVRTEHNRVYEMLARRVAIAGATVGVLVTGYEVNDEFADSAKQQTTTPLVVLLDGAVVAASSLYEGHRVDRDTLAAALADVPTGKLEPSHVTVGDVGYAAMAAPFPGYSGPRSLRYVVLRSLEHSDAERVGVLHTLVAIGAVAIGAAFILAFWLARRLVRPLDGLVQFTRKIGTGGTEEHHIDTGPTEVRHLGEAMNQMVRELEHSRREMAGKERLEGEIEIATRMQSAILPRSLEVSGARIAAWMTPATEIGGDYYDVLAVDDGCWIGFGDVAGHGLPAGIVMVMVQSAIAGVIRHDPEADPSDVIIALNRVIFTNVRRRLRQDEYVTILALRYDNSGRLRYAGAHEEILLCRAATGRCERLETPGTFVGAVEDIGGATEQHSVDLATGDLVVLYSDGVVEAPNASGERYGIDRLIADIERLHDEPVEEIVADLLVAIGRWAPEAEDDATLLVLRHVGPGTAR